MIRALVVAALSLSIATSALAQVLENESGERRAADRAVGANEGDRETPAADPAQTRAANCALPSEPWGIPAALDAAITGPADKDRACFRALLTPEARLIFVSLGADGAPSYRLETVGDWIARTKARGHIPLEEKQPKFRMERFGAIAQLWSTYVLFSDGKQVARGINSIQAIREAGGWRIAGIMVQAESAAAPLLEEPSPEEPPPEEYIL